MCENIYFKKENELDFHWDFVYCHGQLEIDNSFDIGSFNTEKVQTEGLYHCLANRQEAIIRMKKNRDNMLCGRVVYINDIESMKYLLSGDWD